MITGVRICAAALFLGWASCVSAEPLKLTGEARELAHAALVAIGEKSASEGFDMLRPGWLQSNADIDDFEYETIRHRLRMPDKGGKWLGVEFIREQMVGESLYQATFIEKFEKTVMGWMFVFYRPGDVWKLRGIIVSDEVETMF